MIDFAPGIPLEVTVFQCSVCRFQAIRQSDVHNHINRKRAQCCTGARVLSTKCSVVPGRGHPTIIQNGNHNTATINNITVQPTFYAGSNEERAALFRLLTDPDNLKAITACPPEEIPATIFRLWKGADAPGALKNITVKGDRVEEVRGPDRVVSVPRTKFLKTTVGDMFTAVTTVDDTDLQKELAEPMFGCGKRRSVSRTDAARMSAAGSHEVYKLDSQGREFLRNSHTCLDKELAHYSSGPPE